MPHSEISGSTPVCGSPKLFAAYHVLHRLLAPRHPPYALSSLTFNPHTLNHTACVVGKLPFAGYSVVKDQTGGTSPRDQIIGSGRFPRTPWLAHSRGPYAPRRSLAQSSPAQLHVGPLRAPPPTRAVRAVILQRTRSKLAGLPSRSPPSPGACAGLWRGEGWWRIPGSNR